MMYNKIIEIFKYFIFQFLLLYKNKYDTIKYGCNKI